MAGLDVSFEGSQRELRTRMLSRAASQAGIVNDPQAAGWRSIPTPGRSEKEPAAYFPSRPGAVCFFNPIRAILLQPLRGVSGKLLQKYCAAVICLETRKQYDLAAFVKFLDSYRPRFP